MEAHFSSSVRLVTGSPIRGYHSKMLESSRADRLAFRLKPIRFQNRSARR